MINSPLNMALISKRSNRIIQDYQISSYLDQIGDWVISNYMLDNKIKSFVYNQVVIDEATKNKNQEEFKNVLESRFNTIKGAIVTYIRENFKIN